MIRLPSVCVLCGMLALPLFGEMTAEVSRQPNVLFIAIDDLGPQPGKIQHPNNARFNDDGDRALAEQVAKVIEEKLKTQRQEDLLQRLHSQR